jgi:hypothetical protein
MRLTWKSVKPYWMLLCLCVMVGFFVSFGGVVGAVFVYVFRGRPVAWPKIICEGIGLGLGWSMMLFLLGLYVKRFVREYVHQERYLLRGSTEKVFPRTGDNQVLLRSGGSLEPRENTYETASLRNEEIDGQKQ